MGLFSKIGKSLKKAVKKVGKGIKKVVKKVGKVVKKVTKSKLFKAIATIGAIIVTGGAALTAFGATGGAGTFTGWMMSKSAAITGGQLFGSAAGKTGFSKFLTQTGNLVTKAASKPFEALGTAAGSATRAVTDFTGVTTPKPTTPTPSSTGGASSTSFGEKAKDFAWNVAGSVTAGVATGYAQQELLGGDPTGEMAGLAVEGKSALDPLAVYAPGPTMSVSDIYNQLGFGTGDPGFQASAELFRQETLGVA